MAKRDAAVSRVGELNSRRWDPTKLGTIRGQTLSALYFQYRKFRTLYKIARVVTSPAGEPTLNIRWGIMMTLAAY